MNILKARDILPFLAFLFGIILPSSSVTPGMYKTGFCMCQLDSYLISVRAKLKNGVAYTNIPPTPTLPTKTTPSRPSTTTSQDSGSNSGSTTTGTGSTAAANSDSTTTGTGSTAAANPGSTTTGTGSTAAANTVSTTTDTGSTAAANPGSTTTGTGSTATANPGSTTTGTGSTAAANPGSTTTGTGSTAAANPGSTTTGTGASASTAASGSTPTTTTAATTTTARVGRKKRSAPTFPITNKFRSNPMGVPTPTWDVVFDTSVRIVDDVGVMFSPDYSNASLCSCTLGSIVQLNLCLLNVVYSTALYSSTVSNATKAHLSAIVPWLDLVMNNSANYIRVLPTGSANYYGNLQLTFMIEFNRVTYLAAYEVSSALGNLLTVPGPNRGHFLQYATDFGNEGCFNIADLTTPPPTTQSTMANLRFLGIPIAIGVLALLIFCLCFGKRDKFYVRFW